MEERSGEVFEDVTEVSRVAGGRQEETSARPTSYWR